MTGTVRARRIDNEWRALLHLAETNPDSLVCISRKARGAEDVFAVLLRNTGCMPIAASRSLAISDHSIELRFPRFYPALPLEAFLREPVFHPNVDPRTGFLCLWESNSPGDSAVEAIRRVQAMLVWKMFNLAPVHVMQPEAAEWFQQQAETVLPLQHEILREPFAWRNARNENANSRPPLRKRLTALSPDQGDSWV